MKILPDISRVVKCAQTDRHCKFNRSIFATFHCEFDKKNSIRTTDNLADIRIE
jgi:hypothetical protein